MNQEENVNNLTSREAWEHMCTVIEEAFLLRKRDSEYKPLLIQILTDAQEICDVERRVAFTLNKLLSLFPHILDDEYYVNANTRWTICQWVLDLVKEGELPFSTEQYDILRQGLHAQVFPIYHGVPTPEELIRAMVISEEPDWFRTLQKMIWDPAGGEKSYNHPLPGK